jgi:hypothetical protein
VSIWARIISRPSAGPLRRGNRWIWRCSRLKRKGWCRVDRRLACPLRCIVIWGVTFTSRNSVGAAQVTRISGIRRWMIRAGGHRFMGCPLPAAGKSTTGIRWRRRRLRGLRHRAERQRHGGHDSRQCPSPQAVVNQQTEHNPVRSSHPRHTIRHSSLPFQAP